ncbi:MAG: hypothetical protein JKY23_04390 [Nitrospinaceae bacterium]|nr:hypothetical protein [Nitrospinaceae bacterium]
MQDEDRKLTLCRVPKTKVVVALVDTVDIVYRGDVQHGKYHGHGILYTEQHRMKYEGGFSHGKFHGIGVYRRDTPHSNSKNEIVFGNWADGQLVGQGKVFEFTGEGYGDNELANMNLEAGEICWDGQVWGEVGNA